MNKHRTIPIPHWMKWLLAVLIVYGFVWCLIYFDYTQFNLVNDKCQPNLDEHWLPLPKC